MAFVFRNEKKVEPQPLPVGPGSYNFDVPREVRIPKAYVPFGTMESRSRAPAASLIGPGSYNLEVQNSGEKIISSSATEQIKLFEVPRPHPAFKSQVKRFPDSKPALPGPGEYNVVPVERPKMLSTNTSAKAKIIEHLISINQYQSIPSIPSLIHSQGYIENDHNELSLNKPKEKYFKGEKTDSVAPNHYNPSISQRPKGLSWTKGKEYQPPAASALGPGSYEVTTMQPLCSYKPTSQFASKTLRTMPRGERNLPLSNITESRLSKATNLSKNAPSTHVDSEEEEYEYIEDTTPGPGAYFQANEEKKKTQPSFGKSNRFNSNTVNKGVGPGSYEAEVRTRKPQRKKIAVKEKERGEFLVSKGDIPGPGTYEPRNTMQDKLITKIQRGYRGQFGSIEPRSKEQEEDTEPGPGFYEPQAVTSQREINSSFKSKVERKFVDGKEGPAPGSYNLIYANIATKVIKEEEEDPDLIVERPGFGVGERRFEKKVEASKEFEDEDIIKEIQQKHREERRLKMMKPSAAFKSGEPRLKSIKDDKPGPGAYHDGEEDRWNKRTYNILFADI